MTIVFCTRYTVYHFIFVCSLFWDFLFFNIFAEDKICDTRSFVCKLYTLKYYSRMLNFRAVEFANISKNKALTKNSKLQYNLILHKLGKVK